MKRSEVEDKFNALIVKCLDDIASASGPSREKDIDFLDALVSNRAGFLDPTIYRGLHVPIDPQRQVNQI